MSVTITDKLDSKVKLMSCGTQTAKQDLTSCTLSDAVLSFGKVLRMENTKNAVLRSAKQSIR